MTTTSRLGALRVLAVLAVAGGCGTTAPKPAAPTIAFTNPTAGEALTSANGSVSAGALTLAVTATTTATTGSPATLTVDGAAAGEATANSAGQLSFGNVALAGSAAGTSHTLVAKVTDSSSGLSASATITVTVTLTTSTGVCSVAITPATGTIFNETGNTLTDGQTTVQDENLNQAGMQAKIVVTVGAPCADGDLVTLTVGGTALAPVALSGGTATFDQTTLPDTPVAAFTSPTPANELAVEASVASGSTPSTETVYYLVDSSALSLTITSPTNNEMLGNLLDIDPSAPGLQIDVIGTSAGFASWLAVPDTIELTIVNAQDAGYLSPLPDSLSLTSTGTFSAEITLPNNPSETITVYAETPSGNTASASVGNLNVAATPVIAFVSPTAGELINSTFGLVDGGVAFQVKVTTTADQGSTIYVCSNVPNGLDQACPVGNGAIGAFLVGTGQANGSSTATIPVVLGDDGSSGNQTLGVWVVDSTQNASATETIAVHIDVPVIESISIPGAVDAGGLLWWNASMLDAGGTAQGVVTVTLDTVDSYAASDGGMQSIVVLTNTSTSQTYPGTVAEVGGIPTATIPLSLADNGYPFAVAVTDLWGNPSNATQIAPISNDFDLYVKTSLPVCALASPVSGNEFNVSDNGNDAGSGNVSIPVTVSVANVSLSSVSGSPIDGTATVLVNGATAGSTQPAPAVSSVLVSAISPQGADVFTGTVTDPAGNPTQPCDAGFTLTVDTVTPTIAVTINPDPSTQAATYTSTRTISMNVVTTADLPVGTLFTVQIGTDIASCEVTTVGGAGSPCLLPNAPNGTDTVVVTAIDGAGNTGTGLATVVVDVPGCDLTLTSPTEVPLAGGGDEVLFNTSSPTLVFQTSCAAGTNVNLVLGTTNETLPTTTDSSGSTVTFTLAGLVDGSTGTFTATASGTGGTVLSIEYVTKLTPPAIGSVSPGVSTFAVVAYQDNLYAGTDGGPAGAGGFVFANGTASTTAADVTFSASNLSDLGPVNQNGNIGEATLTAGGTTLASQLIVSGQTSVTFTNVALPALTYPGNETVTLTIADNAGNAVTSSWVVVTDVVPPTAPTVTPTIQNKHAATVLLTWTVPPAGSGSAITGYEDHYVVTNLGQPTISTPTETQYAAWTVDTAIPSVPGGTAGAMVTSTVTGLPTFNQYTFEVRSIDGVGNRSPLGVSPTVSSLGGANGWQQLTIVGPDILTAASGGSGSDFGFFLQTGHFTSSQYRDLIITMPNDFAATPAPGAVYILYGTGSYSAITQNATWPDSALKQIQVGTSATGADDFGYAVAVADFNGDGFDDLAVGAPQWNNGQGRVDIFFGSAVGLCGGVSNCTTPGVTMFGDSSSQGLFGFGLSAVGDINNDKIQDLLVGAPSEGAGGTAYLFLGAATWPTTPTPATTITSPYVGDALGARWGSVALGDVNGDAVPDFSIGAPGGGIDGGAGNEYFISGKVALNNSTMTVNTSPLAPVLTTGGTCDINYNYLSPYGIYGCFGVNAVGSVDFTGGALPDLGVSSGQTNTVYIYPMSSAGPGAAVSSLDQVSSQGWSLAPVDLNGDGKPDLIAGVNDNVGDTGYVAGAFVYLNTGTGLPNQASAIIPPGTAHPAGDYFGFGVTAADLRDQGSPDFVISDVAPVGEITIYY